MQVLTLGSAAGGGFPQWNCACHNCSALRAGRFAGKVRTQAQLAVGLGDGKWFLLGASPDLRTQIETTVSLQPRDGVRQSPIVGVILASAELDHVMGLLLLRELQPFSVYSTPSVRQILREDNSFFRMLNRAPEQVTWRNIRLEEEFRLEPAHNCELRCRATSLGSRFPAYVTPERSSELITAEALVGLVVQSPEGKRLGCFPTVPKIDENLLTIFESLDLLFFDGTFWSDDEMIRVLGGGRSARQMGHIPVSSREGSLKLLMGVRRPRKIFFHINNTNPMLDESSEQFTMVREAGWEIAEDGWELQI